MPSVSWPPEPAAPGPIADLAAELHAALRARRTITPLSGRNLGLGIDDAYAISLEFLRRRLGDGEKVIGKKIGVTSKPVQDMLGVHQPDFGFMTDAMMVPNGATVRIADGLIAPRAEAEIAFILKKDLKGPGVDEQAVLDATEAVVPCFEIVDSRIENWKIAIVDTVADNASCGICVLGDERVDPRRLDLPAVKVEVFKNGAPLSTGLGSAVQGSPLTAVAWLANTLGRYGVPLEAGELILSGSLVPLAPAAPGDHFEMNLHGIGRASIRFS
jgi:2-oxopent-4-enoate/cis-2-oxohex-4-enoate hydratase